MNDEPLRKNDDEVMYRYWDNYGIDYGIPIVRLEKYTIIKETPCGYWIELALWSSSPSKKWVSKTGRNSWAKLTEAEALESYIKRKESHIGHLDRQLQETRVRLATARNMKNNGE